MAKKKKTVPVKSVAVRHDTGLIDGKDHKKAIAERIKNGEKIRIVWIIRG